MSLKQGHAFCSAILGYFSFYLMGGTKFPPPLNSTGFRNQGRKSNGPLSGPLKNNTESNCVLGAQLKKTQKLHLQYQGGGASIPDIKIIPSVLMLFNFFIDLLYDISALFHKRIIACQLCMEHLAEQRVNCLLFFF